MTLPDPPILVITHRRMAARRLPEVIGGILQGGCRWVLLRETDLSTEQLVEIGQQVAPLCAANNALLSVSADLEAAAAIGADGLHLPQRLTGSDAVFEARARLGNAALVGISCHSQKEAETAERQGADYITLSPVFLTESKPGYGPALGAKHLRSMVAKLDIPVLALGGIAADNVRDIREAGATGFAVMGSVMRATDPAKLVAALTTTWRG